ncbi:MAG: sugar transferase [Hyphomicrobiales bacterium]|nr:MAG: sugar transferase [Hyphomicrobiales bacterium]
MIRFLDILMALSISIPAAPILLACAIAIRLTSPGPAVFAQRRVGRMEAEFVCYKLRTMKRDTVSAPSHQTSAQAITPLGRFLRSSKLDELPQLWNVIKGEMSFVGPRPCLPIQLGVIDARRKKNIFSVRPGITGPAQVKRIDMSDPDRLAGADVSWVNDPSIAAYFSTIAKTALGHGGGDRVPSNQGQGE